MNVYLKATKSALYVSTVALEGYRCVRLDYSAKLDFQDKTIAQRPQTGGQWQKIRCVEKALFEAVIAAAKQANIIR